MSAKPYVRLTHFHQLASVAFHNMQHVRELAAQARTARDFGYAAQLDRIAGKWSRTWQNK